MFLVGGVVLRFVLQMLFGRTASIAVLLAAGGVVVYLRSQKSKERQHINHNLELLKLQQQQNRQALASSRGGTWGARALWKNQDEGRYEPPRRKQQRKLYTGRRRRGKKMREPQ